MAHRGLMDRPNATAVASFLDAEIISKYAFRRISLQQQPVERSMRFELQSFGETMVPPTREFDRREEWIEISRNRLFRSSSTRTGWWRSVVTATSLVTAHAIAGIAWSAVVMYPNLLSPPSNQFDDDDSADDLRF